VTLRPDQLAVKGDLAAAFRGGAQAPLVLAPTGWGKTHFASDVLAGVVARGGRGAFAADREEIAHDTAARLRGAGLRVGLVMADAPRDPTAPVQVVSIPTATARGYVPGVTFAFFDEAHHAASRTWRALFDAVRARGARVCGLTATAQRGDGAPLDMFDALVPGPAPAWCTAQGLLVPCELVGPPASGRALACDPVEAYARWGAGRRAIVFANAVAAARGYAEAFTAAGVPAECVTGETDRATRAGLRARLASGETRVLCGVGVFLEGFDAPGLEVAIFARPFNVVGSWLQALGRISRTAPGKSVCTAIDLCGSWVALGLRDDARVWSLDGAAVRRAEPLPAMSRCATCAAVFPPRVECPRCGARAEHLERVPLPTLSRAEVLARVSDLPPAERDRRYLAALERTARVSLRLDGARATRWALGRFRAARGRDPEATT
jgi:superfamily II DNA or RNA helicase